MRRFAASLCLTVLLATPAIAAKPEGRIRIDTAKLIVDHRIRQLIDSNKDGMSIA